MNIVRVALAFLFLGCWSIAAAQEKEEPKPVPQPELKQGQPGGAEEEHGGSVKELDAFHESLHPLVHEMLPKKDYSGIRAKLPDLLKSARAVAEAKLPERLASRQEAYTTLGNRLVKQVTTLRKTRDIVAFEKLFNDMHMTFEKLVDLCAPK
jgi:hypothetical protein